MAESAAAAPRPGVLLADGRYQLEERIGSGGMATVWRATDRRLRRPVAIKLISEALADDPTYAARFAREARTAAGLSHANLVGIYDYGADDHQPFLVMEYVDGGTLADRLERGPVLGAEAAAIAGDLLGALAAIHAAGILHRDIKPANVLLSSDGRARVTDFGIAQPEGSTRLTETGHLVGTLRYLAPEVIDGQPASPRSDLYALGVLLRDLAADQRDPTTEALVAQLTERVVARRPASAEQARELLGRPAPAVVPRVPRAAPAPATAPAPPPAPRAPVAPTRREPRRPARVGASGAPRERHGATVVRSARPRIVRILVIVAAAVLLAAGVVGLANRGGAAKPTVDHATPSAQPGLAGRLDELDRLVRAAGQG
jgi:serine/threonine-protein kinase